MDEIIELLEKELKYRKSIRDKDFCREDFLFFDAQIQIIEHILSKIKLLLK